MRFSKIKVSDKGVELAWTIKREDGETETTEWSRPEEPLSDFTAAMQGFVDYVGTLIGAPDEWDADMRISTINFSETKDGRRGIIVTAIRKIEAASNRVLVINTPLMHERGETTNDEATGIYSDDVAKRIEAVERYAAAYRNGERAQLDLLEKPASETADPPADDLTKRRRRKKADVEVPVPATGTATGTASELHDLLMRAGRDAPVDAIERWSVDDRMVASGWAIDMALGKDSPEPDCLKRDATPALLDQWASASAPAEASV